MLLSPKIPAAGMRSKLGKELMETIAATATAVPPYLMTREATKQAMREVFRLEPRRLAAVMSIFDNAQVERRHSVFPIEYLVRPRSLTQTNAEYQEHALALSRRVALDCLEQAGLRPSDVDFLISVSCTGYMIPSLDAYLIGDLGFRPNVRRLPITELGCVAGAMALSRARELVRAFPDTNALVITVELPTLTLQHGDYSQANLVSCALFGDGAAAALVTSRATPGAQIIDTEAHLFPDSLDAMGFDLRDNGFHMVLSKDVPDLLRGAIGGVIRLFLARHGLTEAQLSAFLLHPGGKKILYNLEDELGIARHKTAPSWEVLRDFGNLSSATLLFVLREWMTKRRLAEGAYGLMAGFGPGLSAELLLLRFVGEGAEAGG
jgi:alkylresorcinol/alkylpyrone synthase